MFPNRRHDFHPLGRLPRTPVADTSTAVVRNPVATFGAVPHLLPWTSFVMGASPITKTKLIAKAHGSLQLLALQTACARPVRLCACANRAALHNRRTVVCAIRTRSPPRQPAVENTTGT